MIVSFDIGFNTHNFMSFIFLQIFITFILFLFILKFKLY